MTIQPAASDLAVYSARPRMEIAGSEDLLATRLMRRLEMRETEGGLSSLEVQFENAATGSADGADFAFEGSANDQLSLGAEIRVVTGPRDDPQEIFQGTVSALELVLEIGKTPALTVMAEDALMAMRLARRTRLFEAGTLQSVAETLAGDSGLRLEADGLDMETGPDLQLNETDLGFLRRLLGRHDCDCQIVGTVLQAAPRAAGARGDVALAYGDTLLELRAVADLADQVGAVTWSGWDPSTSERITAESSGSATGPGSGRDGAAVLAEVFGQRSEHAGAHAVRDAGEAQALVDTLFQRRARRFVSVEGTATGDPAIRIGATLELSGIGPRFSNRYAVTETIHRFDEENGYRTEFRAESAYFGG
ncbi:phage late control D family protein [Mangrovicoccus sp. HB161399]|uniref:phage late control D family protein n=1 Tax=Mangrovicoccus sp. HB161399 TaxID=2720392 RepID=UPI0015532404|nr:contractile injection system protein, VgrG/Pvc8 family [Mangrovicoccus sp. HB161399]